MADERQANIVGVVHLALDLCASLSAAAEQGLLNGSIPAVPAFKHAEEAFGEAQQCVAQLESESLRRDIVPIVDDLGRDSLLLGSPSTAG